MKPKSLVIQLKESTKKSLTALALHHQQTGGLHARTLRASEKTPTAGTVQAVSR